MIYLTDQKAANKRTPLLECSYSIAGYSESGLDPRELCALGRFSLNNSLFTMLTHKTSCKGFQILFICE